MVGLTIPHNLYIELGALVVVAVVLKGLTSTSTSKKKKRPVANRPKSDASKRNNRKSFSKRSDEEILHSPVEELSWSEFERLLALYFMDHGYDVEEPGIGGNDGGVDLVITDKRTKERTAVQAKHWSDRRPVGPNIIRELHSARRNTTPSCHFGMLVTSSDVTQQARKEAQDRYIDYWHGTALQLRLEKWDKWQGKKRRTKGK